MRKVPTVVHYDADLYARIDARVPVGERSEFARRSAELMLAVGDVLIDDDRWYIRSLCVRGIGAQVQINGSDQIEIVPAGQATCARVVAVIRDEDDVP